MSKANVAIATDSTSNIPDDLAARYNIHIIPQILNWEGESLLDGVDITTDEFYARLAISKEIPTTSQASSGAFKDFFTRIAKSSESIVGIFVSGALSGTLDSARNGAELAEDVPIEIIDSRSASMGLGFIAIAAARAAEAGLGPFEVAQVAEDLIPRMRLMFVLDTLEFIHRGGRIGGAQRFVGTVLSIKPLLHLYDGKVEPLESIRTKKKAIERMLSLAEEDTRCSSAVHAAVLDAAISTEAAEIHDQVVARLKPDELIQADLSPVVGAHTGPGTVGLVYYCEE
ncbi:MAG: DegV family EDD domain-containing protein [Anaerolineales bacterium]|nr:DegV family EDD domain-containing protein [Anaerolineales bacterium]